HCPVGMALAAALTRFMIATPATRAAPTRVAVIRICSNVIEPSWSRHPRKWATSTVRQARSVSNSGMVTSKGVSDYGSTCGVASEPAKEPDEGWKHDDDDGCGTAEQDSGRAVRSRFTAPSSSWQTVRTRAGRTCA